MHSFGPHARRTTAAGLALLLAAVLLAPASASGAILGYFEHHAAQEAVLSEMALHPAAIDVDGKTVVAYQGVGFDPYVVSCEASTGTWSGPFRVGTNPLALDAHGAPALFRDGGGRIHALHSAHNGALRHSVATDTARLGSWEQLPSVFGANTYPQPLQLGPGQVLLFHRGPGNSWYERRASGDCETFGPARAVLAGDADTWWYADFRNAPDGTVHATFVRLSVAETAKWVYARHDVYYMRRTPDGSWSSADGTTLTVPVNRTEADAHCRVLNTRTDWANEVSVKTDAAGRPCILALVGLGSGPGTFSWRFLRHDGSIWRSSEITVTDHFFDSGAFRVSEDGTLEAFLTYGDSDAEGSRAGSYRGRGGFLGRWTSSDDGATWTLADPMVGPDEPGTLCSDPQFVLGGTAAARLVFTDWNNDESDFNRRMFLWGDAGLVTRKTPLVLDRVAGADRVRTAIEASKHSFPERARTALIARADDFPDALAGAPLAHAGSGPLLLTSRYSLSPGVLDELRRLKVTQVTVLGGTSAVSKSTVDQLVAAGLTVRRLGGATRYDTAAAIARELRDPTRREPWAVVVSGRNWPDAVCAGPVAANLGCPVLLADGDTLPASAANVLLEWGTRRTLIVGGADVVGDGVMARLPSPVRVGGVDRYETSALLARWAIANTLLPGRPAITTGLSFPDALAGGPLAARTRGPLLLTRRDALPAPVSAYLRDTAGSLADVYLIGEPDVVGTAVASQVASLAR